MVVRIENSNGSNNSNSSDSMSQDFALRVEVGKEGVQGN